MSTEANEHQVGDDVRWLDNPFTIVAIKGNKALLKQRFSIGVNLKDFVPIEELISEEEFNKMSND